MAENQHSDQRNRRQGGGQNRRKNNYNNRRDGDSGPRTEHETYRREGSGSDYTPPSESRKTTFGGGEYERVYRDKPAPKVSLGKRILGILSFGLLGKDKPAPAKPTPNRSNKPGQPGNREDRPRRERNGDRPERGEQRRGGDRGPRNHDRGERPARENRRPAEATTTNTQTGPREPRQKQERAPQAVDLAAITTPRLHVGNLSYDTVESDLFELFSGIGKVTNAEIVTHSRTQRSKGFGFVQLTSIEDAKRAAEELHGKTFMGRVLMVGPAKGNKPTSAEGNQESEPKATEE